MFTGIVSATGKLAKVEMKNDFMHARIICPYDMETVALGSSIACDGTCLTVVARGNDRDGNWFDVDISNETLAITNLINWKAGYEINCERAMKIGDEIGGHLVSGHVDNVAMVEKISQQDENTIIEFNTPTEFAKFIAPKGSVCLNGTSLTVNRVMGTRFTVNLIPHTLEVTTWKSVQVGDHINLEIDMMARYVARLREFEV